MKNLKFKNLAMATVAVLSLAACNNSDDNMPAQNGEVQFTLKTAKTSRGLVTDPAGEAKIEINSINAKIFQGGSVKLAKAFDPKEVANDNGYKFTLGPVMLAGQEKVMVVLNNTEASTTVAIDKIQPTAASPMVGNAIYAAEQGIGTKKEVDGKTVYDVTATAGSIVARLEVKGAAQFNKELVKDMYLSSFTPYDYSLVYGLSDLATKPSEASLKTVFASAEEAAAIADVKDGKVLANHLFKGDKASVALGFTINKYDCLIDDNGVYVVYKQKDVDKNYFIYKGSDKKYYVNMGTVEEPRLYPCDPKKEGDKWAINMADAPIETPVELAVVNSVEYFTLGNFKGAEDGYVGGKIYKLNLNKGIVWNENGGEFTNVYNPETNKGTDGEDKVTEKTEAKVNVTVTVTEWSEEETEASIL